MTSPNLKNLSVEDLVAALVFRKPTRAVPAEIESVSEPLETVRSEESDASNPVQREKPQSTDVSMLEYSASEEEFCYEAPLQALLDDEYDSNAESNPRNEYPDDKDESSHEYVGDESILEQMKALDKTNSSCTSWMANSSTASSSMDSSSMANSSISN